MQLSNILSIENMFRFITHIPNNIIEMWLGFVVVWIGRFLLIVLGCFIIGLMGLVADTVEYLIKKYKITQKNN